LVKPPRGKKIVAVNESSRKKEGMVGVDTTRCKAALVAKGYNQIKGVDFNEVFSQVVSSCEDFGNENPQKVVPISRNH